MSNRNPRFWGFSFFVPEGSDVGNKGLHCKTGTLRTVRNLTYYLWFTCTISPRARGREVLLWEKLERAGQKVQAAEVTGEGASSPCQRAPCQKRGRLTRHGPEHKGDALAQRGVPESLGSRGRREEGCCEPREHLPGSLQRFVQEHREGPDRCWRARWAEVLATDWNSNSSWRAGPVLRLPAHPTASGRCTTPAPVSGGGVLRSSKQHPLAFSC